MDPTRSTSSGPAALSAERAFVLWVRGDRADGRVAGRIEHVASGRTGAFAGVDELLAFVDAELARLRRDGAP